MMFLARGIALSLSVMVLLYASLSLVVASGWRMAEWRCRRFSPRVAADFLFGLRIMPLMLSGLATLVFMVPSFLLLEPHSIDEPIGAIPLALSCCGVLLFVVGMFKATVAQVRTTKVVADWSSEATRVATGASVPVFRTGKVVPALTAAGILQSKVLMSDGATAVLTESEFRTALAHEVAHVRSRDNLKKLLFRFCAFPGMAGLEKTWSQAVEIKADDAAVSNASEALDLASALIKLSRWEPVPQSAELTTALLQTSAATVSHRVERLIAWDQARMSTRRFSAWYSLLPAFGMVVCAGVTYNAMLSQLHLVTEWLVR
jgi:Zn-dependent protease with chaperone function